MDELLRWAIEGGSFGIALFLVAFLFKKFVTKEIIDPIEELQKDSKEVRSSFIKFTENINSFVFRIIKGHGEMIDSVNKNANQMNTLFAEATRHTSQAKTEAHQALEKVNAMSETADKLVEIGTKNHLKNKKLETEVKKISDDVILIKNKIGIKNED